MTATLKNEFGETITCRDDNQTKDEVWELLMGFFLKNGYTDECIHQCDSAMIDGLELLVNIARKLEVQTTSEE